jgi:hypothetical protein
MRAQVAAPVATTGAAKTSSGVRRRLPRSAFDRAAAEPLTVTDTYSGEPLTPEPGVRYFLRQLLRLGAATIFSCEGHPEHFYVLACMPLALAMRVVAAGYFAVELTESPLLPECTTAESLVIAIRLYYYDGERDKRRSLRGAADAWEKHFGSLWETTSTHGR